MQRTSSLDIIALKKHKKDNLMQSQLKKKKKKKKKKKAPERLLHLWLNSHPVQYLKTQPSI